MPVPVKPYQIRENSWLASLAARKLGVDRVAFVLGHTIHLHNASSEDLTGNHRWFRHELCHVCQFERYGFLPFIFLYLWESLRKGYRMNRFEVEAREAEERA